VSIVTPMQVEARLKNLSKLIDEAHDGLVTSETNYHTIKAEYEIAMAKTLFDLAGRSKPTGGNYTVGERDALALITNENLHTALAKSEALVKASRANVARLRVQVDIARSIGTSVRTGMEL